ncbi:MAG: MFS transporter [Elusimicrobiota bacterium]|jgi:hypothetical protein
MKLVRSITCLVLALLTGLWLPPQAWAQVASLGTRANASAVPTLQVVQTHSPTGAILLAGSSGLVLGQALPYLGPSAKVAAVVHAAAPSAVVSGASLQAVLVHSAPSAASSRVAAPVQPAATVPARRALSEKASELSSSSAPLLKIASADGSSPAALHGTGAALQDLLQGSGARRYASDQELPAASGRSKAAGLLAVEPAHVDADSAPQAPELSPQTPAAKATFRIYAAGVAAVKVGIETLNLAVPLLLLQTMNAAVAVSALYLAAECASLFAGFLGGALVDRVGAGRAMALTGLVQGAAIVTLPFVLAAGGASAMPIVYGLFMLNGVAGELFDVARRAALPQIVGKDEGGLRVHNGRLYVWREIAAMSGVFGAGMLIKGMGAMSAVWVHPVFCLAAGLALLKLWRLRPADGSTDAPIVSSGRRGLDALRVWWADLLRGMRAVRADGHLRTLVLVNIPLNSVHKIFHTLIAVVYATKILGDPAMAAVLLFAWNMGEFVGAFYLERRGEKSRFSTWLRLAALASLSIWAYPFLPTAWVAVPVSFLIAAAMIGNELGTASYMQSHVPESELGAVTGFVYGLARAVGMLALLAAGWAFDSFGAAGGFYSLAAIFTVLAPIYLLAAKRFKGEGVPGGAVPQDD